jgi:hypothetical protein
MLSIATPMHRVPAMASVLACDSRSDGHAPKLSLLPLVMTERLLVVEMPRRARTRAAVAPSIRRPDVDQIATQKRPKPSVTRPNFGEYLL